MKISSLLLLIVLTSPLRAVETEISAPETGIEREDSTSALENEERGIIPEGGLTISTRPMTPISAVPELKPRDQARAGLKIARDLLARNKFEAASDVALQAYDDFAGLRLSRLGKKGRQELRRERREAATVYMDASIAYIQQYVKKNGSTAEATQEGRERLSALRDVAVNYPELSKKLQKAYAAFETPTP